MNIQAEDGKWYIDPIWQAYNYMIYTNYDEDIILNYKGQVLWATARRILNRLGIKAKLEAVKPNGHIESEGSLCSSSVFSLKLIRPIPVPQSHKGFFDEAPKSLFNGRTLSWKRSGKRWIPTGQIS